MQNIKITKKITSLLLVALILITFSFNVFAANTVTFTTYNAEVFAGDEFNVDIFVSDNSLIKTASFVVGYDERQMTFLDLNVGAIVTAGSDVVSFKDVKGSSGNSYVQIEYNDSSASLSSAGKLFSLTFAANDNAKGQTNIKLSAKDGKIEVLSGAVTPKFNNSEINIINTSVNTSSETTPPTEESSSDVSKTSSEPSSAQNTEQNSINEVTTQNSQAVNGKNEKKSSTAAVFAVLAVIAVVAVLLVSLDLNGKNKKKRKNKRKKKSRK